MKRLIAMSLLVAALMVPTAGSAFADDPHAGGATGQPSQSCQATNPPAFPGNTGSSPGSAFNGTANAIYANPNTQGGISSGNSHVVAQYDVACFQQASH
jgi:hypothetical protein